jgi:arylsulfatase A-like enzyme
VHAVDPHEEYAPESPFAELWVRPDDRKKFESDWKALKQLHPFFPAVRVTRTETTQNGVDPEEFTRVAQGLYDGDIAFNDDQLSILFETLSDLEDLDNTLIVLTSDHGEEFFDHEGTSHGFSLYNELLSVPLIFSFPLVVSEGEVVSDPIPSLNIAPTILSLVGAPPLPQPQGKDMAPFLRGEDELPLGPIFAENYDGSREAMATLSMGTASAVIFGRFKLVFTGSPPSLMNPPKYQLFDLAEDPHELKNVAQAFPDRVASLEKTLLEWSSLNLKLANPGESISLDKVDPGILSRLKELGYIK